MNQFSDIFSRLSFEVKEIIKNNYLKHRCINSYQDLTKELDRAVSLYNNQRPHKSLNYRTPKEIEN